MTFEKFEEVLGRDVVQAIVAAVEQGYVASRSSPHARAPAALKQLLSTLIVTTTVTPDEVHQSKLRIERCLTDIRRLADETRETLLAEGTGRRAL
ncbi:MAG: hypothetical protein JSS20_11905 [Proteobacteria bacterium]|nr:hypothetical protein [Pseudomonadota bacterium]